MIVQKTDTEVVNLIEIDLLIKCSYKFLILIGYSL